MAKLTGYAAVAVINQNGKDYHFAIYEHGYKVGDKVLLSNGCGVWEIKQIIDPDEAERRFGKNITAEVVCAVDMTAYEERVARRKEAESLKKKMDTMIKAMDENSKYEMYAKKNPELMGMLNRYKEITA